MNLLVICFPHVVCRVFVVFGVFFATLTGIKVPLQTPDSFIFQRFWSRLAGVLWLIDTEINTHLLYWTEYCFESRVNFESKVNFDCNAAPKVSQSSSNFLFLHLLRKLWDKRMNINQWMQKPQITLTHEYSFYSSICLSLLLIMIHCLWEGRVSGAVSLKVY